MRKIAVIGLGRFGSSVAVSLAEKGVEVLGIDSDREKVDDVKDKIACAVQLDSTEEAALREIGIEAFNAVIVCIGDNVEANLLTTALLKKMGIEEIYARAMTKLQAQILKAMEIKRVINPEEEMGLWVANSLVAHTIEKQITLSTGHSFAEVKVPAVFAGKTLKDVNPRRNYKVNVIAIKKRIPETDKSGVKIWHEQINDVPQPDDIFGRDDILIVIGSDSSIAAFAALK